MGDSVGFLEINTLLLTLESSEFSRKKQYANKYFQYSQIIAVVEVVSKYNDKHEVIHFTGVVIKDELIK